MSTPYIGQITAYAFGTIPKGWMPCNGQLLQISQNQPLFALIGTTYGGNGTQTFALPNLQGLMPLGMGSGFNIGQTGGEANHALMLNEMPTHTHPVGAATATGSLQTPAQNNWPAAPAGMTLYSSSATAGLQLDGGSSPTGAGQGHPNQQPYLALTFCIAVQGIFPSRS
jgi:microcystin-dependent protein